MNKILKYSLPGFIFGSIVSFSLVLSSLSLSSTNQKIEAFQSTTYDFLISDFSNNDKVNELTSHEAVEESSRFYNFSTPINGGKKGNVLLGLDHEYINLSFFHEKILLEGEYLPNGIIVDDRFASEFNLNLGDTMRFSLNGEQIFRPVTGIFVHSIVSTFSSGVAIAPWLDNYQDLFDLDLIVDLVFVSLGETSTFGQHLQRNNLSSLNRSVLYSDIKQITSAESNSLLTLLSVFTVIAILGYGILMYRNFISDQKEISINIKEKNAKKNLVFQKTINISFLLSIALFILSAVGTLVLVPFLQNFYVLFLLSSVYFLISYFISLLLVGKVVNIKTLKKQ